MCYTYALYDSNVRHLHTLGPQERGLANQLVCAVWKTFIRYRAKHISLSTYPQTNDEMSYGGRHHSGVLPLFLHSCIESVWYYLLLADYRARTYEFPNEIFYCSLGQINWKCFAPQQLWIIIFSFSNINSWTTRQSRLVNVIVFQIQWVPQQWYAHGPCQYVTIASFMYNTQLHFGNGSSE